MQIFGLQAALVVALAAFASADVDTSADVDASRTLVTFYEHVNFSGSNNKVSNLNKCQDVTGNFVHKASSAKFYDKGIKCNLYRSYGCKNRLYTDMDRDEANFITLGINDQLASVTCKAK